MTPLALIAEDEDQIADVLDRYFIREGFRTSRAGDGVTTLDLHAALKPDVVLLDVMIRASTAGQFWPSCADAATRRSS